jgi:hypothetical protein
MKLLAVSDIEVPLLCSPGSKNNFNPIDLLISCGDLPNDYLSCLADILNAPLCYVLGNHQISLQNKSENPLVMPDGTDLHQKCIIDGSGIILAGIQGSLRYNMGHNQYSQAEMWSFVLGLVPIFLVNKVRFGRYLDLFISHAPAWEILDGKDQVHRGSKAFRWLVDTFQPMLHLFGHVHLYRQDAKAQMYVKHTLAMNVYGYREIELIVPHRGQMYPKSGMTKLIKKGIG